MTVSLADGAIERFDAEPDDWTVHLVETGQLTNTGGRVGRLGAHLRDGTFMLTYGDGVSNINLTELLAYHNSHGRMVTVSAVRPPARFGALEFDGDRIRHFKEKSTLHEGWINGGFFVVEPQALDYVTSDVMWEHAPMEALAREGQLFAYRHEEFWQCMDTLRDLRYLESLWDAGRAPWKTW
jgi:glucose-1-phosphate cytidylyltransferase